MDDRSNFGAAEILKQMGDWSHSLRLEMARLNRPAEYKGFRVSLHGHDLTREKTKQRMSNENKGETKTGSETREIIIVRHQNNNNLKKEI